MSGSRIFAGSGSGPTLAVASPSGEPFALEPLFDAVDLVMTKSPRVQLGRPILTQLVTRLFNAQQAGIPFDLQEVVEQTLVKEDGSSLPTEPTPKIPAKLRASREFDGSVARPKPTNSPSNAPEPAPVPEPSQEAAPQAPSGLPEPVVFEQLQAPVEPVPTLSPSSLVTQMSADLLEELENEVLDDADKLGSITFDAWALSDEELITRCSLMAMRLNLAEKLNVDQEVIVSYFRACQSQMHADAPFHNWHHVADVTQCLYTLLSRTGLAGKLSTEQLIAVFLAAPAHDLDHRGRSNVYEINENTDIAQAFPGILQGLSKGSAELVRVCLKNAILATDMGRHGALMNRFNSVTAEIEMEITLESTNKSLAEFFQPGDKGWLLLGMLLKASDVSNPSRPIRVADKWNDLVYQEFYAEGDVDLAKGRPLNPLHDRKNNVISKSSVGFIGFVVLPIFQSLQHFLETVTMEADEGDDYTNLTPHGVRPFCEGLMLNKNTHAQRTAAHAEDKELSGRQRIGAAGRLVKGQLSRT